MLSSTITLIPRSRADAATQRWRRLASTSNLDSRSKCSQASCVSSICLRRASSVSASLIQPFSRMDLSRPCIVAGEPKALKAIMSRTDSRLDSCEARATNARMRSSRGSSDGNEGNPRSDSTSCRNRRYISAGRALAPFMSLAPVRAPGSACYRTAF